MKLSAAWFVVYKMPQVEILSSLPFTLFTKFQIFFFISSPSIILTSTNSAFYVSKNSFTKNSPTWIVQRAHHCLTWGCRSSKAHLHGVLLLFEPEYKAKLLIKRIDRVIITKTKIPIEPNPLVKWIWPKIEEVQILQYANVMVNCQ